MTARQGCCQSNSFPAAVASTRAAARGRFFRLSGRALSAGPAAFAFVIPKCPLCFAAWAAVLGAGAAGQRHLMVTWLRPVLITLLLTPLLMEVAFILRHDFRGRRKEVAGPLSAAYASPGFALSPIAKGPE